MTDKELDDILNQIKAKNNIDIPEKKREPISRPEPKLDPIAPPKPKVEPIAEPEDSEEEFVIPPINKKPDPIFGEPKGISLDDFDNADIDDNYDEEELDEKPKKKPNKALIIIIALIALIAIASGVLISVLAHKGDDEITTKKAETTQAGEPAPAQLGDCNPLTGEANFPSSALNKRPVAVVVENEFSSRGVRPQWGLEDVDICLEGESEASTRLLLFWADYNDVPEQVGPTRSARPPFIHFSQLFDSIFIHAGLSHTRDNYKGADDVFKEENIDHINLLKFEENSDYFGRDYSRTQTVEHTGFLKGENVAEMLDEAKIDTNLNTSKFSTLTFNQTASKVGDKDGSKVYFKWSNACHDEATWIYDADSATYKTDHFDSASSGEKSGCEFTNLIFLLDTTEYITKNNYKGYDGNSETYCDYKLAGGKGMVVSNGSAVEITWGVENGKLWMKDSNGKTVALNPGKSYIGYGSTNNGGEIKLADQMAEETTEAYNDYE